jgi:hypothetical protein
MRIAVIGDVGPFLVTHAGVTAGFWSDLLGAPADAEQAAHCINRLAAAGDDSVFRPGCMLTGRVTPTPDRCGPTGRANWCPVGSTGRCPSVRSTGTARSRTGGNPTASE